MRPRDDVQGRGTLAPQQGVDSDGGGLQQLVHAQTESVGTRDLLQELEGQKTELQVVLQEVAVEEEQVAKRVRLVLEDVQEGGAAL